MTAINVFQRNWAFTDKDSDKPLIRTGRFGPCCVATFTAERYAALTHIDAVTDFDSITVIFKAFIDRDVKLKDVKVIVLGGWGDNEISTFSCTIVVQKIFAAGFQNVSTKNMFTKKSAPKDFLESDAPLYYHFGAQVDARSGTTFILKKRDLDLSIEQNRQTQLLLKQSTRSNLPITKVT